MSAEDLREHKEERKEEVAQEKFGKEFEELSGGAGGRGEASRRERPRAGGAGPLRCTARASR